MMQSMTSVQDRTIELLESATPKEKLKKWIRGYIPEHYKRISIDMEEAVKLATIGATESKIYFGETLFFTQALLFGAVASGKYDTFIIVTPSQYGKSWLCGQLAIWLANKTIKVHVAGGSDSTTEIIMDKVIDHLQHVHPEVKNKLLGNYDKIEKMQTSTSKTKIAMAGGGFIDRVSLGASVNDAKKFNKAIGRGGAYIVDEAGLIPDDAYAEIGRREFSSVDGKKELLFQISNPHRKGTFYDKLLDDSPPEGTLIVWMDARTSLEEGRIDSIERVVASDFFKNNSTCQRYLLCELEEESSMSMFGELVVDDSPIKKGYKYYFGIDSAYKGADKIRVAICALTQEGKIRLLDIEEIDKGKQWIEGVTSKLILNRIKFLIKKVHPRYITVDVGFGVWIAEGLASRHDSYRVKGINFGSGPTKERKEHKHYSATNASNMRAELHLDLQDLIEHGDITCISEVKEMLKEEMRAVKSFIVGGGKKAIISKDEIKSKIGHSPDELDSALLAIHSVILDTISDAFPVYS